MRCSCNSVGANFCNLMTFSRLAWIFVVTRCLIVVFMGNEVFAMTRQSSKCTQVWNESYVFLKVYESRPGKPNEEGNY